MENKHASIHAFDVQLICDYFSGIDRQGPGSPEVTLKALSFIDNLTPQSRIADIGCGTGGQTRVLAQHAPGCFTGIDLFPGFIDLFNQNASRQNLQHRVNGVVGDMENLPFEAASLDVIWSEGAIYNIGFQRGLNEWRQFLTTGGYIAVSEASWLTDDRPEEIHAFWQDAYPEIDTIAHKVAQLQAAGFVPTATFVLPETCWTDQYYVPQRGIQEAFLHKHAGSEAAKVLVANELHEAALYDRYKAYYGYVFYIGKKRG